MLTCSTLQISAGILRYRVSLCFVFRLLVSEIRRAGDKTLEKRNRLSSVGVIGSPSGFFWVHFFHTSNFLSQNSNSSSARKHFFGSPLSSLLSESAYLWLSVAEGQHVRSRRNQAAEPDSLQHMFEKHI